MKTLLILATLIASSALAQSDELAAARSEYEAADTHLNDVWQDARTNIPAVWFDWLRDEQREWLRQREGIASASAEFVLESDDVVDSAAYYRALATATRARTDIIEGWIRFTTTWTQNWSGYWIDGSGGSLTIEENDVNRIRAVIDVSRSAANNIYLGQISGHGHRNEHLGLLQIPIFGPAYNPDRTDAWVFFRWEAPYLVVDTANARSFAGLNASFDGRYIRIRDLSSDDRRHLAYPTE